MDDSTKDPQVQQNQPAPVNTTTQVATPVVQQPQAPAQPIGSMHKEAGPTMKIEAPVAEILTPSEQAPELSEEVENAGVEVSKNPEVPDLTMHDKKLIDHAPVNAPVPTQPSGMVQLPLTEETVTETLKHKNTRNSLTWLAELVAKMHAKMKGEH